MKTNKKGISAVVILVFIIIIAIIATVVVISVNNNGNTENNETGKVENIDEGNKENVKQEEEVEDNKSELLTGTYQFPTYNIYVDVPMQYSDIEKGYTQIYKNREKKYVTFNCFIDDVASTAEEAFDVSYPKFKTNVSSWHRINTETFNKKEMVTINGISALKVTGTVEYGMKTQYNCYFYGYAFIFEGKPCSIMGVVMDKEQPQEEIDELTEIVDGMMKSVRNKR